MFPSKLAELVPGAEYSLATETSERATSSMKLHSVQQLSMGWPTEESIPQYTFQLSSLPSILVTSKNDESYIGPHHKRCLNTITNTRTLNGFSHWLIPEERGGHEEKN
jgi:hypothetical protein